MPRHLLYEINLDRLTAFCTKCGYTEIVIPKTRTGKMYKPICANRAKEILEKKSQQKELAQEEKESQPQWQLRHVLTQIDPVKRTAVCSICGPTDIWISKSARTGRTRSYCGNHSREYLRKYKIAHSSGRPTNPHALSHVNEEAGTAICATCGPVKVEFRIARKYMVKRCPNAPKPRKPK